MEVSDTTLHALAALAAPIRLAAIDAERAAILAMFPGIDPTDPEPPARNHHAGAGTHQHRKSHKRSAAARANMAKAQRKAWRKRKAEQRKEAA